VKTPQKYIAQILEKFNLKIEEYQLEFGKFSHHQLAGNQKPYNQCQQEQQIIQKDVSYLEKLSFYEWWLGTVLAFPGLKLFNYSLVKKS
jgi:hypothetical protein